MQGGGNGTTKKNGPDSIAGIFRFYFVKGEDYESIVHEVRVTEERPEESAGPVGSERDGGIVPVVSHVGSDE